MNTENFNVIDKVIAYWRLSRLYPYIPPNSTVLDFGCGYQKYLLKHIQPKIVKGYGIDYSIQSEVDQNIEYIKLKFTDKLPLPSNSIDTITMLAVIEHIPLKNVDLLMKEFCRILKPNGRILLTTPTTKNKSLLEFLAFKLKLISAAEIADHVHYYSQKDFKDMTQKYHLKMERYQPFQFGLNQLVIFQKN